MNPYEILNVPNDASLELIRRYFLLRAKGTLLESDTD